MSEKEMIEFLQETKFCDITNPRVLQKANELLKDTEFDSAIAIWDYISSIPYRFDFWSVKASETLDKGYGMCTNKANLQIALLRANEIPAAYGVMKIKREALKSATSSDFYEKINPITTHIFCYTYLDGKWIASDATPHRKAPKLDRLDNKDIRFNLWDGKTQYKKHSYYVICERPFKGNLDNKLSIKPRFLTQEILDKANDHIDKLEKERRE